MLYLLFALSSATCPEWTCSSLNSTICTKLYGYRVLANNITCPRDLFCKLSDFASWYKFQSPSSTKSFNCTRQNYEGYEAESFKNKEDFFCGFRSQDDELASGLHPKICSQDYDCLTKGGWTSQCLCGLDGLKYCVAELGSNAYDDYWDKCLTGDGSATDPKISAAEKEYWDFYARFYVEIVSAPECVKELLWEFMILKDLDAIRKKSQASIMGSSGWVWLMAWIVLDL